MTEQVTETTNATPAAPVTLLPPESAPSEGVTTPVTTDGTADGTQETSQPETKEATKAESKVPEAYDLKAPEGAGLDAEGLKAFEPIFKEVGLSQEQAQKLVNLYGEKQASFVEEQKASGKNSSPPGSRNSRPTRFLVEPTQTRLFKLQKRPGGTLAPLRISGLSISLAWPIFRPS